MKVEEPGEYGNKSKNSMYENIYTGLFNFGNIRTVSVSYTHLDVYKRQVQGLMNIRH